MSKCDIKALSVQHTFSVRSRYKNIYCLFADHVLDPENYAWDLLDDDLLARLSARNYVSLSRERKLGITSASTADDTFQEEQQQPEHLLANTDADDTLFHVNMPGILSIGEVTQQVPLEEVRIRLKGEIIDLGVRAFG